MVDLKKSLPKAVTDIYEMGLILDSISRELERLSEEIYKVNSGLALKNADASIEWWERDFSVPLRSKSELNERKRLIFSKIELMGTQTKDTIERLVKTNDKAEKVSVIENGLEVIVTSQSNTGFIPNTQETAAYLRKAVPAHLSISYEARSKLAALLLPPTLYYGAMTFEINIGE